MAVHIAVGITFHPAEQEIPESEKRELHSLAIHEAGHYIVPRSVGASPIELKIISEDNGSGSVTYTYPQSMRNLDKERLGI